MALIGLVSCVKTKASTQCAAADLYTSVWFRKARFYAEKCCDRWYILSAKHGLISPDTVIAPYEETLATMPAAKRREWAAAVISDLMEEVIRGDEIIFLAGAQYREHLIRPLAESGIDVSIPMEGLGIGQQLAWLNKHLSKCS